MRSEGGVGLGDVAAKRDAATPPASEPISIVPPLLVLLPLAFDYKGTSAGGSLLQLLLVMLVFVGFYWMVREYRVPTNPRMLAFAGIVSIMLPVLGGFLHVLLGEVYGNRFVRVALPYVLMVLGFATAFAAMERNQLRRTTLLAALAALVSTVFTAVYAFTIVGDVQDLRHRVLSPVFAIAFVYAARELVVSKQRTCVWASAVVVVMGAVVLSVTRSAAITVLAGLFAIFVLHRREIRAIRSIWPIAVPIAGLIAVGLVSFSMGKGTIVSHWYQRVLTADDTLGFDLTAVTRLAEIDAQLSLWLDNGALSLLFGRGLGAEYGYSSAYDHLLRQALAASVIGGQETFSAGHNFWIYSLFSGGLVFGLWLPILVLCVVARAMTATIMLSRRGLSERQDGLVIGLLVLICFVASTIGGNPLGSRLGALMYGYFLGLTVLSLRLASESPSVMTVYGKSKMQRGH
jgi:hypothetical protein